MTEQILSGTSKDNRVDFYIEKNDSDEGYFLHIFNSDIENVGDADKASIEKLECNTHEKVFEDGLAYCIRFNKIQPKEVAVELQAQ